MKKQEFIKELEKKILVLPLDEKDDLLNFYGEVIDEKIEEGFSEEEAIKEMGSIDDIVNQIISDIPLTKIVKERIKPKKSLNAWNKTFLIVGSPIWASLLIIFFVLLISIYVILFACIVSLWAVEISLILSSIMAFIKSFYELTQNNYAPCFCFLGIGLVGIGVGIIFFMGCKVGSTGIIKFTKKIIINIKKKIVKKEKLEE